VDRRTRELEILNAIAEALNATNDVRGALETTLALVTDLLGLHSGWVWLLDPETNQLYNAAAYNLPPYLQEPIRMSGTWCLCTDALRSGELMSKNVDVIECSRLSPAVRKRAIDLTSGLRFHASVSLQFQSKPLGVMNVTGPSWRKLTKEELRLLSTIALQVGAMIERSRLAEGQASLARAEERTRMARELHDTLLQSLTAIALQLEATAKAAGISSATRERLQRALDTARSAAIDAKRAVSDLRASPLAGKPLAQALKGLARGFVSDTGVSVTVRANPDVVLAEHVEAELFRIAQEALTNVAKHAGAKTVEIGLRRSKGNIELSIVDDGRGFERDQGTSGHGLQGMTERATLLGGTFVAGRKRGGGSKVVAKLPLDGKSP
jgi:two-component system, NarL family, sensor kinase